MVRIEVTGNSVDDAFTAFGRGLALADTDTLTAELTARLAMEDPPRVLNIVLWADTGTGKAATKVMAEKAKRVATKTHSKKA